MLNQYAKYTVSGWICASFSESDPTVPTNVKSISDQNILDWGNAAADRHTHLNGLTLALISGQALTNWNAAYNWYNSNPLSSYATTASLNNYVALSQTGNWNTVYNWYNSNPLSDYVTN
jgi:hypothetical protein